MKRSFVIGALLAGALAGCSSGKHYLVSDNPENPEFREVDADSEEGLAIQRSMRRASPHLLPEPAWQSYNPENARFAALEFFEDYRTLNGAYPSKEKGLEVYYDFLANEHALALAERGEHGEAFSASVLKRSVPFLELMVEWYSPYRSRELNRIVTDRMFDAGIDSQPLFELHPSRTQMYLAALAMREVCARTPVDVSFLEETVRQYGRNHAREVEIGANPHCSAEETERQVFGELISLSAIERLTNAYMQRGLAEDDAFRAVQNLARRAFEHESGSQ